MFPEIVIPSAGIDTSKSKDMFGAGFSPEHAGLFTSRPDNGFAAGFDHAGSDEVPLPTEGSVLHAVDITGEVEQFLLNRFGPGASGTFLAGFSHQALDAVFEQPLCPFTAAALVIGMIFTAQQGNQHIPGMVQSMIEIDDLDGVLEVDQAQIL